MSDEAGRPDGVVVMSKADYDALVTTYSEATSGLRFVDGRLQQAFKIESWQHNRPMSRSIEWREVPSVSLADANQKDPLP